MAMKRFFCFENSESRRRCRRRRRRRRRLASRLLYSNSTAVLG